MRIELPYSYDEITIRQIQKHGERQISDFEKVLIYSNQDADYLKKCPQLLIEKSAKRIDEILESVSQKHFKIIEAGGKRLGFIPNWDNLSAGEYIDLETYASNPIANAHKILAILYREIKLEVGTRYSIVDYEHKEDADIFKDCPASYFTGALVFFWSIRRESLKTSLVSLARVKVMNTVKRGDGMTFFSNLRMKILQKWRK